MRARMIVILAFFFCIFTERITNRGGVDGGGGVVPDTVSNFTAQRAAECVLEKYLFKKGSIGKYNVEYLHGVSIIIIIRLLRYLVYCIGI